MLSFQRQSTQSIRVRRDRVAPSSISFAPRSLGSAISAFALATVTVAMLLPGAALAVPFEVFFRGDVANGGDPDTRYGIGASLAGQARDKYGIPILDDVALQSLSGSNPAVTVSLGDPADIVLQQAGIPNHPRNRATSSWTVSYPGGAPFEGDNYLLFTHTDPLVIGGQSVDYGDENIGIRMDAEEGWVTLRTQFEGQTFYYPALLLPDPVLLSGVIGDTVGIDVTYVVDAPLLEIGAGSGAYALPELEIGFANVPIPEPGTALLLGLGLMVVSARRDRQGA